METLEPQEQETITEAGDMPEPTSEELQQLEQKIDSVRESMTEATTTYDDGDTLFTPAGDAIAVDENSYALYYNNLLSVFLERELSDEEAATLADNVNGKIAGKISGAVNMLQIRVSESTLPELGDLSKQLMQQDGVIYAAADFPHSFSPTTTGDALDTIATPQPTADTPETAAETIDRDNNGWSEGKKTKSENSNKNEENPDGNNWWAEAIGAYTAWNIAQDKTSPVKVGILDDGFQLDHSDLAGRISMCPAFPDNTKKAHGTSVASLIGAIDNDKGLRGVSSGSQMEAISYDAYSGSMSSMATGGQYVKMVKALIEDGCWVINNSWGQYAFSRGYKFDYSLLYSDWTEMDFDGDGEVGNIDVLKQLPYVVVMFTYYNSKTGIHKADADSYMEAYNNYIDSESKVKAYECVAMIKSVLASGKDDFLIVQSAGNGLNNGSIGIVDTGVDATKNGSFAGITKERYDALFHDDRFQEIKDHILIVGSVDKPKRGAYKKSKCSNYGETVDIYAPGQSDGIFAATYDSSADTESKYTAKFSGTSAAAPIVSGSAALLWSYDPDLTAVQVKSLLIDNSVPATADIDGRTEDIRMLNIGKAMQKLGRQMNTVSVQGKDPKHYASAQTENAQTEISPAETAEPETLSPKTAPPKTETAVPQTEEVQSGASSLQQGMWQYSNDDKLSTFSLNQIEGGELYGVLSFWHDYGNSSSDEDFDFLWRDGVWEYELPGNRSGEMFRLTFQDNGDGTLNIRVVPVDGSYYSWETGNESDVWSDGVYTIVRASYNAVMAENSAER